jgi:hypothetical protein
MSIDSSFFLVLPSRDISGTDPERPAVRITHRRVGADGTVSIIETGNGGGSRTVTENRPSPFSLMGTLTSAQSRTTMQHAGKELYPVSDSSLGGQHNSTHEGVAGLPRHGPPPSIDLRMEGAHVQPMSAIHREIPTGAAPEESADPANRVRDADSVRLHRFVSRLSTMLSIDGSRAEFSLDNVVKGFPGTIVSLQQRGGCLNFSCRCASDRETDWFMRHAEVLTHRLAARLRRTVEFTVNGREPVVATKPLDDDAADAAVSTSRQKER